VLSTWVSHPSASLVLVSNWVWRAASPRNFSAVEVSVGESDGLLIRRPEDSWSCSVASRVDEFCRVDIVLVEL
jgi:hypothetical protein